jgi:hypothetical protein
VYEHDNVGVIGFGFVVGFGVAGDGVGGDSVDDERGGGVGDVVVGEHADVGVCDVDDERVDVCVVDVVGVGDSGDVGERAGVGVGDEDDNDVECDDGGEVVVVNIR